MTAILLLICAALGMVIYFGIVRPFLVPLEWKIPTARAYMPTLGAARCTR